MSVSCTHILNLLYIINFCTMSYTHPLTLRYGQMTAGSYCYIGPQGIVHGTTVSVMVIFLNSAPPPTPTA